MKAAWSIVLMLSALPAFAQESRLHAEFRKEAEQVKTSCGSGGLKAIGSCAVTLATAQPLHLAFGSLAPQSGFAFGAALVGHHTPNETWRINWNGDAVATPGGSWRAGAYAKFVRTGVQAPRVGFGPSTASNNSDEMEYPVFSAYHQAISLDKLLFFGVGPSPAKSNKSLWGMTETITGGNALVPVPSGRAGLALIGGLNGRFVRTRGQDGPFAAALQDHTHFVQVTGGLRLLPSLGAHVRPNYLVTFDRFVAPAEAKASFNRWTLDLRHDFPLYKTSRGFSSVDSNGPDDCLASSTSDTCPAPSHDRNGTFSVRVLTIGSRAGGGNAVPFYLQPTLGGSDINGNTLLGSFDDYRFRAPNAFALQAIFEHSLPRIEPVGIVLMAEQGKAALDRADLFKHLEQSYAAGLTVRAGGFPAISLLFANGNEGHHISATVSATLLGGSSRPSLY